MKHLGFKESGFEDFLYDFHQIKSPEKINSGEEVANWEEKRAAEIEEMQEQEEINTDPEYQGQLRNGTLNFESEWMMELYT